MVRSKLRKPKTMRDKRGCIRHAIQATDPPSRAVVPLRPRWCRDWLGHCLRDRQSATGQKVAPGLPPADDSQQRCLSHLHPTKPPHAPDPESKQAICGLRCTIARIGRCIHKYSYSLDGKYSAQMSILTVQQQQHIHGAHAMQICSRPLRPVLRIGLDAAKVRRQQAHPANWPAPQRTLWSSGPTVDMQFSGRHQIGGTLPRAPTQPRMGPRCRVGESEPKCPITNFSSAR